jgi:hypothetical protein
VTLPIAPVKLPADLAGQPNGQIDKTLLTDVGPQGMLHHTAARAWLAIVADAAKNGLPLTYTYGGTYRTLTQQTLLFESRYSPSGTGGGCKTYKGQQWCKKSSNLATAAVPGTSNHGIGLAVDSAAGTSPANATGISSHPKWAWFRANAERYGFSWELQSEPWHIRYVTGDTIPQAVLDYETPNPPLELPMKYYALPPDNVGNRAHIVVIDGACRYRTNGDTDPLPEIRLPDEQYRQLRLSAGLGEG